LNWLNDSIAKINDSPKHVTPFVTASTINQEKNNLLYFVNPILNKPKPAPKKEEPVKKEGDDVDMAKEDAGAKAAAGEDAKENAAATAQEDDKKPAEMDVD
jgi:heat shock 70kDa protein 4